jgi:hypothetical protein
MIANTNAIVASHKMSPASVPSLAENVESTLVDMIGLSPSCHSAANAAAPFRLRLGAEAQISLRIKDNGEEALYLATTNVQKMTRWKGGKTAFGADVLRHELTAQVFNVGGRAG